MLHQETPSGPVPAPRQRSAGRYLLNGAIFVVALFLPSLFVDRWLPYPDVPVVGDKVRYLSLHGNDYETLFIGSSRVNFQVIPTLFDQALAARGRASKSFNAGVLGMRPPEQGFMLDEVLRQPHGHLRWVLIEISSLEARVPAGRRGSIRHVFWHDGPRMKLLVTWLREEWDTLHRDRSADGESRAKWGDYFDPLSVFLTHIPPFLERNLNLGRASYISENLQLSPRARAKRRNFWPFLGKHHDGWTPYALRETMNDKERAKYAESYEARLRAPVTFFHDPASDVAIREMSDAVVRAGAKPIFFLPPMTTERQYFPSPELADHMIIWSFSDVRKYPELFAESSRVDYAHLNTEGAKAFTQALAERFLELPAE